MAGSKAQIKVQRRQGAQGVRYTALYLHPDCKRYVGAGSFGSLADARYAARQAYKESRKADWIDPRGDRKTLDTFFREVWAPSQRCERLTLEGYKANYRNHISPTFGRQQMGKILPADVQSWINRMEDAGVGRSTQRVAKVVLHSILKSAVVNRVISSNPAEYARPLPVSPPAITIFTPTEWEKFMIEVPDHWKPFMKVALATGMRASELRALAPAHVSPSGRITISEASVARNAAEDGTRLEERTYPKGKRSRTINVDRETLLLIKQIMDERCLEPSSKAPLFLDEKGKPWVERACHVVVEACERAGLERKLLKSIRSTKASWMLKENGGDLMAVKAFLGHASVQTTEKYLSPVYDRLGGLGEETPEVSWDDLV